ncbi:MAG: sigma-70 family RNA polymerase sigma factor [Actinomycetota bacterium]|nr:sigma-70 family RNA polymerase sigma factor [Actinomycetota bacterium]
MPIPPGREMVVALDGELTGRFDVRRAYDEHGRVIFGFALNGIGDRGAAEDCVQETFLRAWRARDRYSSEIGTERTWLFAIARNVVVDALRARGRRPTPVSEEVVSAASSPVIEQAAIVDRLVLLEGMARMTPEHRQVIAAVQLDGMTYQQLSDRTGVTVSTLRTRMFYGLRALRETLGEGEEEDHG